MCGIVGYVGYEEASPIVVDGLARLEYRGYDSAGIAVHGGSKIEVVRTVGKLRVLGDALRSRPIAGTTAIGHTRWATHGRPSEANAHPHISGDVALVHNGIIENHLELRRELEGRGVVFSSETDTEVIAHLTRLSLASGTGSLFDAVRECLKRLRGSFAVAVIREAEPGTIVAARRGSPLVVGRSDNALFCGSDATALLPYTRELSFLEEDDLAELKPGSLRIETLAGRQVTRPPRILDWTPAVAERGGYRHFMLKEIHEQPEAIAATLRGRIESSGAALVEAELGVSASLARSTRRIVLAACGTSHHASLIGRYWFEAFARIATTVELASELCSRDAVFQRDDLVIAVSQSGETFDTMSAVRAARARGAHVLSISNVLESQIPRFADSRLYTRAGPEIGVASTKCFTAQLTALFMLAVHMGLRNGALPSEEGAQLLRSLTSVPALVNEILGDADYVRSVALAIARARDVLFLGRGYGYPVALEGALKLKEVSYAHAEGYAAGEMKHGPIALIEHDLPVVIIAPRSSTYDKTLGNAQEVRARDGQVIAIATRGDEAIHDLASHVIWVPAAPEPLLPFLTVVPLQLLAYYVAAARGFDVDQPRNLAKTVTVE